MDLLQIYRLFRKMHQYPNLIGLMRSIFLDVLEQRGVVAREGLDAQALEEMRGTACRTRRPTGRSTSRRSSTPRRPAPEPEEIENYINLVRKSDNCQTLSMARQPRPRDRRGDLAALREFCDIPKGELYISREEAEGIRVALLSHFISSQLPVHRHRQELRHHPRHRRDPAEHARQPAPTRASWAARPRA